MYFFAQVARARLRVVERIDFVAGLFLQHPARPALVHRGDVRFVDRDTRRPAAQRSRGWKSRRESCLIDGPFERRVDGPRLHAHQQREGVRRHVVGRDGVARGVAQVRVMLRFEQRLCESAVRLLHRHDDVELGYVTFGSKCLVPSTVTGPPPLSQECSTPAAVENSEQVRGVLRDLDFKSEQLAGPARAHGLPADGVEAAEPRLAVLRGVLEQLEGRGRHVVVMSRRRHSPPGQTAGKFGLALRAS